MRHVHDILAKHNAEIVASRQWDERRLAYSVEGQKKAHLSAHLLQDRGRGDSRRSRPTAGSPVRSSASLILKVHPKLVDHLVNQAMTRTPGGGENAREEEMDDRPCRRRRDD